MCQFLFQVFDFNTGPSTLLFTHVEVTYAVMLLASTVRRRVDFSNLGSLRANSQLSCSGMNFGSWPAAGSFALLPSPVGLKLAIDLVVRVSVVFGTLKSSDHIQNIECV